jgi:hypothetical protein
VEKRKATSSFEVSVKTPNGAEKKANLKGLQNGLSPWFCKMKMNHHAFIAINCMRARHSSLIANLSGFNTVSMAECECGDRLLNRGTYLLGL